MSGLQPNDDEMIFEKEQWCPDCHCKIVHKDGYWECPICAYSITDEEVDYGDGYSTCEATYEDEYDDEYECDYLGEPECCKACGGPWPDCESSCKIFDD